MLTLLWRLGSSLRTKFSQFSRPRKKQKNVMFFRVRVESRTKVHTEPLPPCGVRMLFAAVAAHRRQGMVTAASRRTGRAPPRGGRRDSPSYRHEAAANGVDYTMPSPAKSQEEEEEAEQQARVADAVWVSSSAACSYFSILSSLATLVFFRHRSFYGEIRTARTDFSLALTPSLVARR